MLVSMLRNFETIVINAYRWLADTYKDGDKIFLFGKISCFVSICATSYLQDSPTTGFSRGAYQVRALAGMIDKVACHWLLYAITFF